MNVIYDKTIRIELTGDEVATAIDNYLAVNDVRVEGARTVRVNESLCNNGIVEVDPSGNVSLDWCKRSDSKIEPEQLSTKPIPVVRLIEEEGSLEEELKKFYGLAPYENATRDVKGNEWLSTRIQNNHSYEDITRCFRVVINPLLNKEL